ncbi:acetyl-CoA C-acyltransferase [bacterium]|nr:acetyl-CoA C-acyltransferase [bacterium]
MNEIWIVGAKRTPHGRLLGGLSKLSALDLAVTAGQAALTGIDPQWVDAVIVGNVLSAGLGMNVARQVGVKLGLPVASPAYTVNAMCASGVQAVWLAAQTIRAGDARMVLCGGTESMSNAPFLLEKARAGYKLGDGVLVDALLRDGLVDPFGNGHMALTAERLGAKYALTRAAQDAYAVRSQQQYVAALADGRYNDEITRAGELARDEHPRPETTAARLAELKPAFQANGTVTAGNASGINDGAAMVVVCAEHFAKEHHLQPLAKVLRGALVGCDPALMGLGPVHATRKLCQYLNLSLADFDLIEINEAFAAQTLACLEEFKLPADRVNVDGGAIALGHPIGASGARLVVHLAWQLARGRGRRALATLCAGGGMGIAVALERV